MVYFILGGVLLAIGIILLVVSGSAAKRAFYAQATDTSKVGDLQSLATEIRADMPAGMSSGFTEYVELKGAITCDSPLRGELSAMDVAIYETKVERMVERREERRDAQGNVRTHWRKHTETVSSNRQEAIFYLEDDSGRVRVKPAKAKLALEKVVDRFEQPNAIEHLSGGQTTLSLGSFRLSVGTGLGGGHSRTIGYKFTEHVLPLGRPIYALGEVADTDDEGLVLRRPQGDEKDKPFLLSLKSEEDLVAGQKKKAGVMKVVGIVLGVGGLGLVIVGAIA